MAARTSERETPAMGTPLADEGSLGPVEEDTDLPSFGMIAVMYSKDAPHVRAFQAVEPVAR
jgi:hypothetical protein